MLHRGFLDMDLLEPSFDSTVLPKNTSRLLRHKVERKLFEEVAYEADKRGLISDEHFSVDGTRGAMLPSKLVEVIFVGVVAYPEFVSVYSIDREMVFLPYS